MIEDTWLVETAAGLDYTRRLLKFFIKVNGDSFSQEDAEAFCWAAYTQAKSSLHYAVGSTTAACGFSISVAESAARYADVTCSMCQYELGKKLEAKGQPLPAEWGL